MDWNILFSHISFLFCLARSYLAIRVNLATMAEKKKEWSKRKEKVECRIRSKSKVFTIHTAKWPCYCIITKQSMNHQTQSKSHRTDETDGVGTDVQKTDSRSSGSNFMALSNFRDHTKTSHQASHLPCSTLTLPDSPQHQLTWASRARYAVLARVIVRPLGPYPMVSTVLQLSWRDLFLQP